MTKMEFYSFYPQFSAFQPEMVVDSYLTMANSRFTDFDSDADEARRLFVAHNLTLYARALPQEDLSENMAMISASGKDNAQNITSKKVGEVSVTYGNSSASAAASAYRSSPFGDLMETLYGRQLMSLIRLHSMSRYVP